MTFENLEGLAVTREDDGRLVRITLNRPDEGNAVTRDMTIALTRLLESFGEDDAIRVISLEGEGQHFCRGRDNKGDNRAGLSAYQVHERIMSVILKAYNAINTCPVPVVARVHGLAAGFGAALSMACDMTIASDAARFSFPEINHQTPPALAMSTLVGKVPAKAISYLIYSGCEIDACEALQFGMVSKLIAKSDFAAGYDALLASIASRPRITLETIKTYERNARQLPSPMASEYAGILLALAQTGISRPS